MYVLFIKVQLFRGRSNAFVDIANREEAKKQWLLYPYIVAKTGIVSRIIISALLQISRIMNQKKLWKFNARQIPGYKTTIVDK